MDRRSIEGFQLSSFQVSGQPHEMRGMDCSMQVESIPLNNRRHRHSLVSYKSLFIFPLDNSYRQGQNVLLKFHLA